MNPAEKAALFGIEGIPEALAKCWGLSALERVIPTVSQRVSCSFTAKNASKCLHLYVSGEIKKYDKVIEDLWQIWLG